MLPILTLILPLLTSVVGKLIPDASKAAEVNAELQRVLLEQQGHIEQAIYEAAKAQAEINLEEAKSDSLFVSGWRPALGWVCVAALIYSYVAQPTITWFASLFGVAVFAPMLDTGQLLSLVFGMLGLGAMRSYEKIQGIPERPSAAPPPKPAARITLTDHQAGGR